MNVSAPLFSRPLPAVFAILTLIIAGGSAFDGSNAFGARTSFSASKGDLAKGKAVFARCAVCHEAAPGVNRIGPSLAAIVGHKAGTASGFAYSPAMKESGIVWTPAQLDAFLAKPSAKIPGTKMVFSGLDAPADRANMIAYLMTLK